MSICSARSATGAGERPAGVVESKGELLMLVSAEMTFCRLRGGSGGTP
jgi:hypothetical protein